MASRGKCEGMYSEKTGVFLQGLRAKSLSAYLPWAGDAQKDRSLPGFIFLSEGIGWEIEKGVNI